MQVETCSTLQKDTNLSPSMSAMFNAVAFTGWPSSDTSENADLLIVSQG